MSYDVAIIGGGPAGSTAGTLLKKYNPKLRVGIFEKAKFPREHVGESQLPACGYYLAEMGCWDKVERANFPIKIGATYLWGKSQKPWDFEFLPLDKFPKDDPRPSTYEGPRQLTAFQVERSVYDKILLDHASETGCEVFEETAVKKIEVDGDRILGLDLRDGRRIEARYYMDASGHGGILRRALKIPTTVPTTLMNVAVWDYWENAEWAVKIGVGGTRVQILSVPNGWIWFIPLGPTRTSIGFVCPASYYKKSGKTLEQLYLQAIAQQHRATALTKNATREGVTRTTTDWSFLADRLAGENWFLIGESGGFADPVLAGGLTLTHESARHAAYAILELDRGELDGDAVKEHYTQANSKRVLQFMRFAEFWYAANGQFSDLQEYTAEIAKSAGINLSPKAAFRWLSLGGFNFGDGARPGLGGLDLGAVREVTSILTSDTKLEWEINKFNVFRLNLEGAEKGEMFVLDAGKILARECYRRGDQVLPISGVHGHVFRAIEEESDIERIVNKLRQLVALYGNFRVDDAIATMEIMLLDGWITGKLNKKRKRIFYEMNEETQECNFHDNVDQIPGLGEGE